MNKCTFILGLILFNSFAFDRSIIAPVNSVSPDLHYLIGKNPQGCSLSEDFLRMLAKATGYQTFVETGTFLGNTTQIASQYFSFVHSVELGKYYYDLACNRFKNNKNIFLYYGNSEQMIPEMIANVTTKAIFFLDAHYSGDGTFRADKNTPIIAELKKIKNSHIRDAVLVIDDTRMFYNLLGSVKDTLMEGYPTLAEIVKEILLINPTYKFALIFDQLVAFPESCNISISPVTYAATLSRLSDADDSDIKDIIEAELLIGKAKGVEKATIEYLGVELALPEQYGKAAGLSRHYVLWYGLQLLENKQYDKALECFVEARKRGIVSSRVDFYCALAKHYMS